MDREQPPEHTSGTPYLATWHDLLAESAVMILAAAAMAALGQTAWMTIVIPCLIAARFSFLYRRGDVVVFLLGVVLGGGNDIISMWKGVYFYTPPTWLPVPIPVWMVLFWGEAFLFFRRLMRFPGCVADESLRFPVDLPLVLDLAMLIPLKMALYRTASIPWVPDAVFAAALLIRYLVAPPLPHERRFLLTILVLGPLYEMVLVGSGLYVYQHPFLLGIPLWLIVYWIYILRILKGVVDRLEFLFQRK